MTRRTRGPRSRRLWPAVVCAAAGLSPLACGRSALSAFLDLPPEEPAPDTTPAPSPQVPLAPIATTPAMPVDTVRPPIEAFLEVDSVVPLLPRDPSGNIDWMAALTSGVIAPRSTLDPREVVPPPFKFDFFFPGPDTIMKARFPHSSHTEWLDCQQCHPRIFQFRGAPIAMADIFQGKACGECHGKVAFPPTTDCERCHVNLTMPPDRAQPAVLGTFRIPRVQRDTVSADSNATGRSFFTSALPEAEFPHWLHRIRYRCKVCHLAIFEPRRGANGITMADISAGRACGTCHNDQIAFAAGFGACQRCHKPLDPPRAAQ